MTTHLHRSKLVTFRISQEEYEQVQNVCVQRGVRSVSAFARTAVEYVIRGISDTPYSEQLHQLRTEVGLLSERIEELARLSRSHRPY